jgi:DNA-binding CsgD family transcriptional regulator
VLYALSWIRSLRGSAIADLRTRFDDASTDSPDVGQSPHRVAGQQLVWRGEVAPARELLTGLAASADARGEGYNGVLCRVHLCELELRTGNWGAAEQTLAEIDESSDRELLAWPMLERCRALVAAGRGTTDEAEAWATSAIDRADSDGVLWDRFEALRARGIVSLLAGDAAAAVAATHPVWEHTRRVGIDDPGVFPVAPELVEALCELDRPADAAAVTSRLLELSERHAHPWGLATAKRCAALIGFADGDADGARAALEEAASSYERLGLRFERARCLLDLGRAERRQRKWGSARRTLERAAAAFDELSSTGWLELTRSELARVGARRPGPTGALTAAEQRVAALAAKGLANKEIAAALFISVHTVEIHLSRAYRKLDIRSRSQLARLAQDGKLPSEPRRRAR